MKKFARFVIYSAYLTLTAISVVFLSADFAGQSPAAGMGMLALTCATGYAVSGFAEARRALLCLGAAVVLAAGTILALPYGGWNVVLAVLDVVCIFLAGRHDWAEEDTRLINVKLVAAGLVLSAGTYLIALLNVLKVCKPQIGYAMYGHVVLSVILVNRRSVQNNAGGQARRMMRGNQALTWGFVAVLTLAVFFEPLQRVVGSGLRWLISAFFDLFSYDGEISSTTSLGQSVEQMDLSALGGEEKVWPEWMQVLGDILIYSVVIFGLLAMVVGLLWALYKAARKLSVWIGEWLRNFGASTGEDYAEESEQLMSAQNMSRQFRDDVARRVKKLFTPPVRWGSLTPTQRVRFLYKRLLEQEKRISNNAENLTPEELCARAEKEAEFAALYDRARYADGEITAQEAEKYRGYLKK